MAHVDAAMTDPRALARKAVISRDPAVLYDNVFITLKQRGLTINKPEDLAGLVVVSFPKAEALSTVVNCSCQGQQLLRSKQPRVAGRMA